MKGKNNLKGSKASIEPDSTTNAAAGDAEGWNTKIGKQQYWYLDCGKDGVEVLAIPLVMGRAG